MSFTKLHELNQSLSQYLLDTLSIDIPEPVTMLIFFILYIVVIVSALAAIHACFQDTCIDSKD